MTKEFYTNEMMSFENLDNVSGGTVSELHDLVNAIAGNNKLLNFLTGATEMAAGILPVANVPLAYAMEHQLKKLHVDANISVGWLGLGTHEVGNSYKSMGKSMTHDEVINLLKTWSRNR